jgi:hypothetical protein
VRPWPHDKVIARFFSKSDLAESYEFVQFKFLMPGVTLWQSGFLETTL